MKLSDATVLIVDDELELLEIFAAWLERMGCRIFTAANGAEALEILLREEVHALVSDIRMPIMDGVTLLRRVHELSLTIPSIILVSGFGDVERKEMHALGVERLLEKPLRRQHLLQALEQGLLEREELWRTPAEEPADQVMAIRMERPGVQGAECGFQLGRGGCCFPSDRKLTEDRILDLTATFEEEGLTLHMEGEVEWFNPDCGCAGLAFRYLDPSCREWVLGAIRESGTRCFIPQCNGAVSATGGTTFQPSHLMSGAAEHST
jgi:CheY-like chemotaxis protein